MARDEELQGLGEQRLLTAPPELPFFLSQLHTCSLPLAPSKAPLGGEENTVRPPAYCFSPLVAGRCVRKARY